ncbi:MAG: hypothetical protein FWF84_06770 [Kiritimatiellaeota bacterium]|nr:hypothetical protein [Kiritimatiellota bacterium]
MTTTVRLTGKTIARASERLLGANLDWASDLPGAIASERLRNTTFFGPAEAGTGLPPPWKKLMDFHGGYRFELEPGQNRTGGPGLRMAAETDGWLIQPGCWVRKGEKLQVRLWARCQGEPVRITAGFRHRGLVGPRYATAEFLIDRSYFRLYTAEFAISATDDEACFYVHAPAKGLLYFDRISVRPASGEATRADTQKAIRDLGTPVMRWPAGCTSTGYHWKRGIGPEDERHDDADPVFHWGMAYAPWGTDDYLRLCHALGTTPHLLPNVGTGTPREAGEWAAYCAAWYEKQGIPLPEIIWQIGNEHYGNHEIGYMTSEMYAATLPEYVRAIRANYPRALICSMSMVDHIEAFLKAMLSQRHKENERLVDFYALHHYACRYDFNEARVALALIGDAHRAAEQTRHWHGLVAKADPEAAMAVTEWGAFMNENHMDALFVDHDLHVGSILYVAATLNEFCRMGDFLKLGNFYSLLNFMPAIEVRGATVKRTLKFDIFRFWRDVLPSDIYEVAVDGPAFTPPETTNDPAASRDLKDAIRAPKDGELQLPWLDALAGSGWLILTNRHPTQPMTVKLPHAYVGGTVERLTPSASLRRLARSTDEAPSAPTLTLAPWQFLKITHHA